MSFSTVNVDGRVLALLLSEPNVAEDGSLKIVYGFSTTIDTGGSGRETREPNQPDLRLQQTCRYLLPNAAESALLRTRIEALGRGKIAVPLWRDQRAGSDWANRIHTTALVVRLSDGAIVANGDVGDDDTLYAPLLIGTFDEQPTLAPWTDTEAGCETEITIVDDSPWGDRVSINEAATAGMWPRSLVPNYVANIDRSATGYDYEQSGVGRERFVENQETAFKWGQEARFQLRNDSDVRLLLATFVAHLGRLKKLTMPWWFRPGVDAPGTPHETAVRFASDKLELAFSGATAEATLAFWQVPWEIDGVEGDEPEQDARAYLYRHKLGVPGGPLYWRFTDYARPITVTEDGVDVTYFPSGMEHDKIAHGFMLDDDPMKLKSFVADAHPWMLVVKRMLQAPLELDVFEITPEVEDAAPVLRYSGEIADVNGKGRKLTATTTVLGGLLDVKVPNFYIQQDCNHEFCDEFCTLDIADWTFTATVLDITANTLRVQVTVNPPGATLADDFFANGDADKGTGATYEAVEIVRSVDLGGGEQSLTIAPAFLALEVGATIALRPSCSGTRDECRTRYNNYVNFGGHFDVGEQNLSVPTRQSATSQGKK